LAAANDVACGQRRERQSEQHRAEHPADRRRSACS
jgi:hypothetical protein